MTPLTDTGADLNPPSGPDAKSERLGRLAPMLLLGTLSWSVPVTAATTLLQAFFAEVDEANKVQLAALVATAAAVAGAVSAILTGALSDRTRSRFGRRKPWILTGALLSAVSTSFMLVVDQLVLVVVLFMGFQAGVNAMAGALTALLPDRVSHTSLGRASALVGLGNLLGLATAGFVAAGFIEIPAVGLAVVPWLMVVVAILICTMLPTETVAPTAPPVAGLRGLLATMHPPKDRDFWLAFAGRLTFLLSLLLIVTYQLFLLTDYFGASTSEAGQTIALAGLVLAVGAGLSVMLAGPLSDRLGRRKLFVAGAGALCAAAISLLLIGNSPATFLAYTAVVSIAYGTFISVDQALMVEVLPNPDSSARDLGFLSAANTAPGVIAPALAGGLVTVFGYPSLFVAAIAAALLSIALLAPIRRVR